MEECIFCKIINKEIPSYKIYEDDLVYAFLDINPIAKGHTLVVSKKHFENIFDINDEVVQRIISISKKIAVKMKDSLGVEGVNLYHASGIHAEQTVFHFHMHIIPRKKDDRICFNCAVAGKDGATKEEFEEIISKLKIEE